MWTIPWLGHAIEVVALGLFVWAWLGAGRLPGRRTELAVALLYGWLLETLDMLLFGTYHYGRLAWWWLGDVPVYIPLLWVMIVHSSMALSDRAGWPEWVKPWADGLLAVLIDVAVDAIAIRLGLWKWRIGLHEGWFGVPAGNLCAWMWVAFWYSALTRLARRRRARGASLLVHALVPIAAYVGLFSSLTAMGHAGRWFGLRTPNQQVWTFPIHVIGFTLVVALARGRQPAGPPLPPSLTASRWLIHGAFLALLLATGMLRAVPALAVVSVGSVLLEWAAQSGIDARARAAAS